MLFKYFLSGLVCTLVFSACSVSHDAERNTIRQLQKGHIHDDTSYIYSLPYGYGKAYRLAQGYFSRWSHKNRAALDFKMKRGTGIYAARGGVVIRVKKDGFKGGWNKKYRAEGNFIVIQHNDSTRAGYWHLQHDGALVNIGDTVAQGQLIALSGRTGYALFPHLHFLVWRFSWQGNFIPTATRFKTSKGIVYLRPLRKYRNL